LKISLINAQICEANNLVPPLGILAVGSVLERGGFDVQLIDEDVFVADIAHRVLEFEPDLVGISFLTPAYTRAKKIASALRPLLPHAKFCAGGFHVSIFPEKVVKELSLDFCVIGEGETTMLDICQRLTNKEDISGVRGICFTRSDGLPVLTPPRDLINDLDTLPLPATHLLDYEKYLRPPGLFRGMAMDRIAAVATSRGCPFHCSYCGGRTLYHGRVRLRSVPSIRDELKHLVDTHRIRGIWIIDECFTLDRKRALEIADLIAEYGLAWGMQTRVDLLDESMVRHFKERGCMEINFGVESGVDRILDILKKGTTRQAAALAFSWCRDAGVRTTANFMVGTPTETEADINETFEFSKQLNASFTMFHITMPLPGTELYNHALATGLLRKQHEFDDAWVHRASKGPLMTTEIPPERLMKIRASFQNYYFARNYLNWRNARFGIHFLSVLLRSPAILKRSFQEYWRHGRLDSFIETMVALVNKAGR
jgi:anaerobic magnesium-protoporphyrin IX monomethyl ester cyclase